MTFTIGNYYFTQTSGSEVKARVDIYEVLDETYVYVGTIQIAINVDTENVSDGDITTGWI